MSAVLGTLTWVLPRPKPPYYPGAYPLHFEKRLIRLLGNPSPDKIIHLFGGLSEIGKRVDIRPEVDPDYLADVHDLHMIQDGSFKAVICDPPYSDNESKQLYDVDIPLRQKTWIKEAVRICKDDGFVVLYHDRWLTKPPKCSYWMRIIVLPGQNHRGRICHIFMKDYGKKYPYDVAKQKETTQDETKLRTN